MKAEEINNILYNIYSRPNNTQEEKKALLEACGHVWQSTMNKAVDIASFMNMLYHYMGYQYDVDVKTTDTETIFCVKTFIKDKEE